MQREENQNEVEFFDAVKEGDIVSVKSKICDTNNPVNVNAINSFGKTALQIAAKNSDKDVIDELLAAKADFKMAILQSVDQHDLEEIKNLVSNLPENIKISDYSFITPTIRAAQLDHYDIVHYFILHKYFIEEPHECDCNCELCKPKSDMLRSQIAKNHFEGLSSPVYMCLR